MVRRVEFLPLTATPESSETDFSYGSTHDNEEDDDEVPFEARRSFSRLDRVHNENMWTSVRSTAAKYNVELVPSKDTDNVKLVCDANSSIEKGTLYYAQDAFYNNSVEPQYVLTVHPDIYRKVLLEVSDSVQVPCGLYFCCHGGDGAHTGLSHDDKVDISLAWMMVFGIFICMLIVSIAIPWPSVATDDEFIA